MASCRSVCRDVYRLAIPLLAAAMICATGVAVVLAAVRLCAYAGPERLSEAHRDIFWIVFWTGTAEAIALATGLLVCRTLNRRIVRLQTELSDLTRAVLHDLKTPFTHIRNAAEEALNGQRDAAEILPDVLESCAAVTDVLNANAEISRACSATDVPTEPFDAVPVVRQCLELYGAIAEDKGVTLSATLPEHPVRCAIFRGQLQHLANNLLDNAIKFTPAGGKVRLSLAASSGRLVLAVSDTGCGIAPEQQDRIFERFYRADFSRGTPGNGLGLALVDAIARAGGGHVVVKSQLGQGATFTVNLPTDAARLFARH